MFKIKSKKYWNITRYCWETKYRFLFFTWYKYSKYGIKDRYILFKSSKDKTINKAITTYIYHDVDDLLKEYGNKWSIPINPSWRYIKKGEEVKFSEI